MLHLLLSYPIISFISASVVQPGNDQSDGTTSMGTQQDTSMPPSSVDSTLDIEDLSANFNTLDTNDDYSYLKDHFDTCIIYTEGNGDKAEQVRSFIAGLDGDFKVVVSDDEKYFGFFTPENLPAVFSKHCVVFMIIIADNLQEDKLAKYLRSTVSMDKANTAQVRPLLFSKSDEKLIPKSLSNTKPIRWYDEYYLRSELPKLLNQCKDRRMIREEKQIKTPKDIQLDD